MTAAAIISSFTFAQAAADRLPVERKRELIWLILFVLAAGITLLVVVMLLMRAWRRNVARLQNERRQLSAALPPDIWKAGGDRLIARMSPFPKPADRSDPERFDGTDEARGDSGDSDDSGIPENLDDLFPPDEDEDETDGPDGPGGPGDFRGEPPPRRPH